MSEQQGMEFYVQGTVHDGHVGLSSLLLNILLRPILPYLLIFGVVFPLAGDGNAGGYHLPVWPAPEAAYTSQQFADVRLL